MVIREALKMKAPISLAVLMATFGAMSASASILYSTIPTGLSAASPDFTSSEPFFEDGGVTSFGALINPVSSGPLSSATVALSQWGGLGGSFIGNGTYTLPMTLTLYSVGTQTSPGTLDPGDSSYNGDATYAVGGVIASVSTTATINLRPASTGGSFTCSDGNLSFNNGGNQQCGLINLVSFSFGSVALPSQFIYGLSFGTGSGTAADALNFGMNQNFPQLGGFGLVGSVPDYDVAYVARGGGITGQTGWASYGTAAVEFDSFDGTPEPATFSLIGLGLVGLGVAARKIRKNV